MSRFASTVCAGTLVGLLVVSGPSRADQSEAGDYNEQALKELAVSRLAHSLDPAVPIALGKAVVRQAALLRARQLLASEGRRAQLDAGWNADAPEWQLAEQKLMQGPVELIRNEIEDPQWFYSVLESEISGVLDAEDADYIATHFTTFAGNEQRILLQMRLIGEVLMANYTFTNRIDHTVPGLEDDLNELSIAYWELEPFRQRDFMNDPQAIRFAGQAAGLKYTRMLAIRGIEGFIRHIDAVAVSAQMSVDNAESDVADYIEMYRQRIRSAR